MRIRKSDRKKTIFRQFILAFSGIVAPIVLCGMALITWQANVIRREMENKAKADVHYGISRLETQVSMAKQQQLNLLNDKELTRFVRYYDSVPVYEIILWSMML